MGGTMVAKQQWRLSRHVLDRRASLSLEMMFGFLVMGLVSVMVLQSYQLIRVHNKPAKDAITMGIMQLQELVALSEILDVRENEVDLLYQNKAVRLYQTGLSLIRTPGTVTYLFPISEVRFWVDEELLFLSFVWQNKELRYVLGKKEWWRD